MAEVVGLTPPAESTTDARPLTFGAFLGTKDEVDILPAAIENLRRIGVSYIVVLDEGSTDGSLEFLADAEAEGDLWVVTRGLDQTGLADSDLWTVLAQASGVDWVIFLDSDEIWLPRSGSLAGISEIEDADVISVLRYNVVLGPDGPSMPADIATADPVDVLLYARPIPEFERYSRLHHETPWIRGMVEPKIMARPEAIERMWLGAHDLDLSPGREWRRAIATDVLIAHVPFRTRSLFRRRASNVRRELAKRPELFRGGAGWQWARWAEAAAAGNVDREFDHQAVSLDELNALRRTGDVRSAADILERPLAAAPSDGPDLPAAALAQPWLSAAALVCGRERLGPVAMLRNLPADPQPAVLAPPARVISLFGPGPDGHAAWERQLRMLDVIGRDTSLAVPQLIASGLLDERWRYIVTPFNPGLPYASVRDEQTPEMRSLVSRWLGRLVAQMHALPVSHQERVAGSTAFAATLARRRDGAAGILVRRLGVTPRVAARVTSWLPSSSELLGSADDMVMAHGGLSAHRILGKSDGSGFEPTGVTGLADACIAPPLFELGPIWWSVLQDGPEGLAGFLAESHLPGCDDAGFPRRALAWALLNPGSDERHRSVGSTTSPNALAKRLFAMVGTRVPA